MLQEYASIAHSETTSIIKTLNLIALKFEVKQKQTKFVVFLFIW